MLQAALGGVIGAAVPLAGQRAAHAAEITATALEQDLVVLHGPGANVLALRGAQDLLLVDGGHSSWSVDLADALTERFAHIEPRILFNTHWHPEQTGSNRRLGAAGTRIVAHENTRHWLGADIRVRGQQRVHEPLPAEALPSETFYEADELQFHGETVRYGLVPQAHTDGDAYVYFAQRNVLATGGVVTADAWPVVDWWTGGWIGGLVEGLGTLLGLADENTRIVPGSGRVLSRAALQSQYEMYGVIFERLHESLIKSQGVDEAIAHEPTRGFKPEWGDPTPFVESAFKSFWGHLRESPPLRLMP